MDSKGKRKDSPKRDDDKLQPSLLLHPGSIPAWSVQGSPMFMPVAVETPEERDEVKPEDEELRTDDNRFLKKVESAKDFSHSTFEMSGESYHPPQYQEFAEQTGGFIPQSTVDQILDSQNQSGAEAAPNDVGVSSRNTGISSSDAAASKFHSDYDLNFLLFHWFYQEIVESKELWHPFSMLDSSAIEKRYESELKEPTSKEVIIPVIGGRYDVYLKDRSKRAVYWEEGEKKIQRCTSFHKAEGSNVHAPYDEDTAAMLKKHYDRCLSEDKWQHRVLINDEVVLFESPTSITHFCPDKHVSGGRLHIRTISHGVPQDIDFPSEESEVIDHLVFIVPGVGSVCDLRFRSVSECVDGFRDISNKLLPVHLKEAHDSGKISRVEFLPVTWHSSLHEKDIGFDRNMEPITLPSIPKLRHFVNDTLLDILLYSSPMYCQAIINTVSNELNRLYDMFKLRNPNFCGTVSVAGHSLGSLILFDILSNQQENNSHSDDIQILNKNGKKEVPRDVVNSAGLQKEYLLALPTKRNVEPLPGDNLDPESTETCSSMISPDAISQHTGLIYPGNNTLSAIHYPRLDFKFSCFFALGSPIAMFLVVRGFRTICKDFCFPTCPRFFHIFHPYDPVAYRIEPLLGSTFPKDPVIIPHHKGRRRLHKEIQENITKIGSEVKHRVIDSLKYLSSLSLFNMGEPSLSESEIDFQKKKLDERERQRNESSHENVPKEEPLIDALLNAGRRIDFVLQEKPIEALNEYLFAIASHATYWNSEDTALMMLKEVYSSGNAHGFSKVSDSRFFVNDDEFHGSQIIKNDASKSLIEKEISAVSENVSAIKIEKRSFDACEYTPTSTEEPLSDSEVLKINYLESFHNDGLQSDDFFSAQEISDNTGKVSPPSMHALFSPNESAFISPSENALIPPSESALVQPNESASVPPNESATIQPSESEISFSSHGGVRPKTSFSDASHISKGSEAPLTPPPLSGFVKKSPFTKTNKNM